MQDIVQRFGAAMINEKGDRNPAQLCLPSFCQHVQYNAEKWMINWQMKTMVLVLLNTTL